MIFQTIIRKFSTAKRSVSLVKEILSKKPIGTVHVIQGWAISVRKMGKLLFLDVSDGSCLKPLQVIFSKEGFANVQNGSSVNITGEIKISTKGQVELHAKEINVLGSFDETDNYPFTLKKIQPLETYRKFLHHRPKIRYFTSVMRCRSAASLKIHQYFNENSFTLINTPVLTSCDCEGAAETFMVRPESEELICQMRSKNTNDDCVFFDKPAYLTVSGQLHLEAITRSIAKVYCFNTAFRAENSVSRLHLSEFYMVEAEEAFVNDLDLVLQRIEDFVKSILFYLLTNHLEDIEFILNQNETNLKTHLYMLENTMNRPFSVMTFFEAKNLINKNKNKFENSTLTAFNLTKAEEIFLVEYNDNIPVFIIDWPENAKPFYMKKDSENSNLVKGVDLLVPNVGELCGGSLREDDYDKLKMKLIDMNKLEGLEWYLELRKFGNVPTGGFGLGFERFLQYLLNTQSIKDTIPFPRWPHNLHL